MEILRASHLCKTYGKGENEVRALDDVSFSIEKGEFVAIVGTSGSGKSTLMHILGGVIVQTAEVCTWTDRIYISKMMSSWRFFAAGRWD